MSDPQLATKLEQACSIGSITDVELLLKNGANPNTNGPLTHCSPLILATRNSKHEAPLILKLLIKYGANLDDQYRGETALMYAVDYGQRDCALELFHAGAKIDTYSACRGGNEKMVRDILNAGVHANFITKQGSLLDLAAGNEYHGSEIIKLLVGRGAKVNKQDTQGFTPLMTAALRGLPQNCRILLSFGADPNIADNDDGETPFYVALGKESFFGILNDFTLHHANLNKKNHSGERAIHYSLGSIKSFIFCIQHGASIHVVDNQGDTLLTSALRGGDISVVLYLIKHGLSLKEYDHRGYPVWMNGIDPPELLDVVLKHGVDINQRTKSGETALHLAVANKSPLTVKSLIDQGIDVNATTTKGETPYILVLKRSVESERDEIIDYLVKAGEKDAKIIPKPIIPEIPIATNGDETDVLRAILRLRHEDDNYKYAVVREAVNDDFTEINLHDKKYDIPEELLNELGSKRTCNGNLYPDEINLPYIVMVRANELKDFDKFFRDHKDIKLAINVSAPVFDKSHRYAMIYYTQESTYLYYASVGYYILAEKVNGAWTIKKMFRTFIA